MIILYAAKIGKCFKDLICRIDASTKGIVMCREFEFRALLPFCLHHNFIDLIADLH
jgi:hypothetical protein